MLPINYSTTNLISIFKERRLFEVSWQYRRVIGIVLTVMVYLTLSYTIYRRCCFKAKKVVNKQRNKMQRNELIKGKDKSENRAAEPKKLEGPKDKETRTIPFPRNSEVIQRVVESPLKDPKIRRVVAVRKPKPEVVQEMAAAPKDAKIPRVVAEPTQTPMVVQKIVKKALEPEPEKKENPFTYLLKMMFGAKGSENEDNLSEEPNEILPLQLKAETCGKLIDAGVEAEAGIKEILEDRGEERATFFDDLANSEYEEIVYEEEEVQEIDFLRENDQLSDSLEEFLTPAEKEDNSLRPDILLVEDVQEEENFLEQKHVLDEPANVVEPLNQKKAESGKEIQGEENLQLEVVNHSSAITPLSIVKHVKMEAPMQESQSLKEVKKSLEYVPEENLLSPKEEALYTFEFIWKHVSPRNRVSMKNIGEALLKSAHILKWQPIGNGEYLLEQVKEMSGTHPNLPVGKILLKKQMKIVFSEERIPGTHKYRQVLTFPDQGVCHRVRIGFRWFAKDSDIPLHRIQFEQVDNSLSCTIEGMGKSMTISSVTTIVNGLKKIEWN